MSEFRVTIADVATRAGVSTQTVSRVINNKAEISQDTRKRVLDVIEELGYRPNRVARSLVTSQTFTIGLVIPDITNPFFSELTRGAEDVAWENGYNVLLCNTVEKTEREIASMHLLEETRVDGVILCSSRLEEEQLFPLLRNFRSTVLVNRAVPADVAGVVRIDDCLGGKLAADHLLSAGCQKIAILAGPTNSFSGCARVQGSLEALLAAGRQTPQEWIIHIPPKRQSGYDVTKELFSAFPEIDGLICYNDLIAVGALQACIDLNLRVPEQIAIIGFDDIVLSRVVFPPLTTLGVSKVKLGAAAARLLLARLQDHAENNEIVIQPDLIVRGSTPS